MTSFQIPATPNVKAAARFVNAVRRALQKAFAEESTKRDLSQSEIARQLGVHRSVISREMNGYKDLTLGRVAELAQAMGRIPTFSLPLETEETGINATPEAYEAQATSGASASEATYKVETVDGGVGSFKVLNRQAA